MSKPLGIVFLFDVDNTLIDNDRVQADLKEHLEQAYGIAARDRYWEILEKLRNELGYVDYLGALERFRIETIHHCHPTHGLNELEPGLFAGSDQERRAQAD